MSRRITRCCGHGTEEQFQAVFSTIHPANGSMPAGPTHRVAGPCETGTWSWARGLERVQRRLHPPHVAAGPVERRRRRARTTPGTSRRGGRSSDCLNTSVRRRQPTVGAPLSRRSLGSSARRHCCGEPYSARSGGGRYDRCVTDSKIIYTHTDEAPGTGHVLAAADRRGVRRRRRGRSREAGHLARRSHPLAVPRLPRARPAAGRRPRRTRPARHHSRGEHHQAAQHLGLDAAARSCDRRAAGPGLRAARTTPTTRQTDAERDIQARYDKVKGSAVNPVLREGNSDRRAPKAVKEYARTTRIRWAPGAADSKTHVATMGHDDFKSNEQSVTMEAADDLRIEHVDDDGNVTVLKASVPVQAGEIVDGTFMSVAALGQFLREQIADAKEQGVLFSLHLKATMMKVSDPIIFGHAVEAFFAPVFEQLRRRARSRRRRTEQRLGRRARGDRDAAGRSSRPRSTPRSRRPWPIAPTSPWSTPTAGSPTCTCPATSSSTPRCRR